MLDAAPDMELDPEEILSEQFAGLVTKAHEFHLIGICAMIESFSFSRVTAQSTSGIRVK